MELKRAIDPALLAEMSGPFWRPVVLVDLDWPSGRRRLHSATGPLVVDGAEYLGVGAFGAVSIPGEGVGLAAQSATLTLYGLTQDALTEAARPIRNRAGTIMLGATTAPGAGALVGQPMTVFAGYMDALRYAVAFGDGDMTHALQLDLGSGPSARQAAAVLHSLEDDARRAPGDTLMRQLTRISDRLAAIRR